MAFDPSSNPPAAWTRTRRIVGAALVALITAIAYGPVFGAGFVYDDPIAVLRNPAVVQFDLGAILTQPQWTFYGADAESTVGTWRPGANILLATVYRLAGPSPFAFHLFVLALHAFACVAAWALARRITRSDAIGFAVALLFAVHPAHVESVAWVSAVADPAFGLCALWALERHLAWRETSASATNSRSSPWFAGCLFLASLAANELALGVALAILLLDGAAGRRLRDWRAYMPYAAALVVYVGARMLVFHSVWAGFDRATTNFGVDTARLLLLRAEVLGMGVRFAAWPTDLRLFHPFAPDASRGGIALPLALCAVWIALCVWLARRGERALFAAAALVLVPLLTLVVRVETLSQFPFSERYLYLPVFGMALFAALLARRYLPNAVAIALLAIATTAASIATHAETRTWHDDEVLFRTAAERSPRSPFARLARARDLLARYRAGSEPDVLREAEREFTNVLELLEMAARGDGSIFALRADHVQANVGLGWVLLYIAEADGTHDFGPATSVFRITTQRYPSSEEAWTGLGVALTESGEFADARAAFERALTENARFVEAHRNLGRLHMRTGDIAAARAAFEAALRYEPDGVESLLLRGGALEQLGDDAGALRDFDRAVELAPRNARPRVQRAILEAKAGRLDAARREVEVALELDPSNAEAHLTLGKLKVANGEKHGALASFQRACDLDPTSFEAHYNAGILSVELEGVPNAMSYLLRAYRHQPSAAVGKQLGDAIRSLSVASPEAFLELATTDADLGDKDGALRWLADVLALEPENGSALFLRGSMLREKGDNAGAREALEHAVRIMPGYFAAQEALARVLDDLGDKARALEHYEAALQILEKAAVASSEFDRPLQTLRERIRVLREEK